MTNAENNPQEAQPVAAEAPVPAPAAAPAPAQAAAPAAAPQPAPKPAEPMTGLAPVTKGNVAGGWNRFAGYKPGQSKDKKNDRRDDRRGRR